MKSQDSLAITQVNRRLKAIRRVIPDTKVRPGWIRYIRSSLGMTLKQLAERTKLSLPSIAQAERSEAAGRVSIATLKKMANAMECEFVYAFVPKTDLEEVMKQAAREKAKRTLVSADVHMTLEDQRVEQSMQERIELLANKLLEKGDVW